MCPKHPLVCFVFKHARRSVNGVANFVAKVGVDRSEFFVSALK